MSQSTEVRVPMPHCCGSWACECDPGTESCFNILGREYVVEVPWCQQMCNRSVGRETVWLVEDASGYTLLDQKEAEALYARRTGRNAPDRLADILAVFYPDSPLYVPDLAPVWQSGTTANGRRYYLLRDLVRYIRNKRLRPVCAYCGAKIRRPLEGQATRAVTNRGGVFPYSALESRLWVRLYYYSHDWEPAIYCTRRCRRNHLFATLAPLESRVEKKRQVQCMKRQVTALRKFARTGDKTVFEGLPEGYGPGEVAPASNWFRTLRRS